MDMDGTRGFKGSLTMEERRRRSDASLCAYCGQPGHTLATCALASRSRQARGTYQHLPLLPPRILLLLQLQLLLPPLRLLLLHLLLLTRPVTLHSGTLQSGTLQPVFHQQFSPTHPIRGLVMWYIIVCI